MTQLERIENKLDVIQIGIDFQRNKIEEIEANAFMLKMKLIFQEEGCYNYV